MRYPALETYAVVRRDRDGQYHLVDQLFDEDYHISRDVARWLQRLDGKNDPYRISGALSRNAVRSLMEQLDDELLLRRSRVLCRRGTSIFLTLLPIRVTPAKRVYGYVANVLLMLLWLPIFLLGAARMVDSLQLLDTAGLRVGWLIGILAGMPLHEISHATAAMGYGGYVFEMGVTLHHLLPGAYVLMNTKHIKRRLRRVQIDLAGIEMNLLLSGVFFLLAASVPERIGLFFGAGLTNLLLASVNLMLGGSLDGRHAIDELLGSQDALSYLVKTLLDRSKRRDVLRQGALGYAKLACGGVLVVMHLSLPLLIILNLIEVLL